MAPFAKIYASSPNNPRVQRIHIIAALNGLELEMAEGFTMPQRFEEPFKSKFPMGKIPTLETPDGFCLAEGTAIARFLAESGPLAAQLTGGTDQRKRAKIDEWSLFAENEIRLHVQTLQGMRGSFRYIPESEPWFDVSMRSVERAIKRLEVGLQAGNGKFLVGEELTLADIMVFLSVVDGYGSVIDAEMRGAAPAVQKYVAAMAEIPEIKKVIGEVQACETRLKY